MNKEEYRLESFARKRSIKPPPLIWANCGKEEKIQLEPPVRRAEALILGPYYKPLAKDSLVILISGDLSGHSVKSYLGSPEMNERADKLERLTWRQQ